MSNKKRIVIKSQPPVIQTTEDINDKHSHKLSDADFWSAMYEAYGICNRAVRVIKHRFKIDMSRQAINERANRYPEKIKECREMIIDLGEETIIDVSIKGSKKERLDAAKSILKTLGKSRGWDEKLNIEHSGEMMIKSVKVEHLTTGVPLATNESDIDGR